MKYPKVKEQKIAMLCRYSIWLLATAPYSLLVPTTASGSADVTINKDTRGLDLAIYRELDATERKINAPGVDFWQQRKVLERAAALQKRADAGNEKLLSTIYSVNRDAFDRMAEIRAELMRKGSSELLMERRLTAWRTRNQDRIRKGGITATDIDRPLVFPENVSDQDSETQELVAEFNRLEKGICDVYAEMPLRLFTPYFRSALVEAYTSVDERITNSQLDDMAKAVREFQMGKTDFDSVVGRLGTPRSKTQKAEGTVATYQWIIRSTPAENTEGDWSSMMASLGVPKTVTTELQFDSTGILAFVCVTKREPQTGTAEEIFRKGERIIEGGSSLPPAGIPPWSGQLSH